MKINTLGTASVTPLYDLPTACLKLIVQGDLKSTTIKALHAEITSIIKHEDAFSLEIDLVEFDISAANIVDSLGINLVLSMVKWATNNSAEMHVILGSRSVYDTLIAVGIERHAKLVYRD